MRKEPKKDGRTYSVQVRTSYMAGKWSGYGRIALVEHLDGEPKWVPIRDTRKTRVIRSSGVLYAGKMVRSELANEWAALIDAYPDEVDYSPTFFGRFTS